MNKEIESRNERQAKDVMERERERERKRERRERRDNRPATDYNDIPPRLSLRPSK